MPPTKAELVGYSGGAQLVVQDGADVELTCRVLDAKPKPDIIWYLGGVEISQGKPCGRTLFYIVLDFKAMLGIRIQIRRIRMFLGLPDPDLLVRGTAPDPSSDPDPSLFLNLLSQYPVPVPGS